MSAAQVTFENAALRPAIPLLPHLDVPWLGTLKVEWAPCLQDGRWLAWDGADPAERTPAQLTTGRIHFTFWRDPAVRPSRLAWATVVFAVGDVAGWTEGHLWSLF